jgi:hypothetical protein
MIFVFCAGATWLIVREQLERRRFARIRRAPTRPIREVSSGSSIRLVGRVRCSSGTLLSPVLKRPCVAYRLWLEQDLRLTQARKLGERMPDFILDDGSGRALVEGREVRQVHVEWSEVRCEMAWTPELERALARHGVRWDRRKPASVRIREEVLVPGVEVAVLGYASREPDPDPAAFGDYRTMPTRVRVASSRRRPVLLTNHSSALH